jgi:hypothetical protein
MRSITLWAGAIPLFAAAAAQAQLITPVEGTRSVSATISATDSGTNIVHDDTRRTDGFAEFDEDLVLKASNDPRYDDTHSHVEANGSGTQTSSITGSRITASLSATAEGAAQISSGRGYATGNAEFYLTFQVNQLARYMVAADAQADGAGTAFGGGSALVYIAHFDGGMPILSLDVGSSATDSVRGRGWVAAGTYRLQGDTSALVDARINVAGTASASWSADVQFFCGADYNVNGAVTTADRDAFLQAWSAGRQDADVDGNGTVNATDRTLYLTAFNQGC